MAKKELVLSETYTYAGQIVEPGTYTEGEDRTKNELPEDMFKSLSDAAKRREESVKAKSASNVPPTTVQGVPHGEPLFNPDTGPTEAGTSAEAVDKIVKQAIKENDAEWQKKLDEAVAKAKAEAAPSKKDDK